MKQKKNAETAKKWYHYQVTWHQYLFHDHFLVREPLVFTYNLIREKNIEIFSSDRWVERSISDSH